MTHQRPARFLLMLTLFATLAVLPACTVNPATGEQTFTAFMSPEKEKEVGAEEHPKIIRQFGGAYEENDLGAYVAQIGLKLLKVSELPDDAFRFTVLNDDKINAFALPGGYVYVTRGLIALAENEAELAGVIAHEIGHVTARHTAERYSKTVAANIGLSIVGVIGSIYGAPREATQALSVGAESLLKGYSRDQELQSDELAVRYMTRAGYDPNAMSSFFKKMKAHDELRAAISGQPTNEESFNFRSTHPRTTDRIEQAITLANANGLSNPYIGRDPFLDRLDGIIFGDDLEQGIRRGRDFQHPYLQLAFTVPEGFVLINTPKQVIARHSNESVILFDMEDSDKARSITDIRRYLVSDWGGKIKLGNVERLDINGMEAWTGNVRRKTKSGPRDIRLLAILGDDAEIFRLVFMTPIDAFDAMAEGLKRTTYSFRRLSDSEAAAIKPLRINVINTTGGDTQRSLSERMSMETYAQEWFDLINAGTVQDGIAANSRVKIISE